MSEATILTLVSTLQPVALAVLAIWLAYLHRKVSHQRLATRAAIDKVAADSTNQSLDVMHHLAEYASASHTHPSHEHPYALTEHEHLHDHTGGLQGHVHWLRYNSTELTDSKRRDVYVCLVPDCKAIFAHNPEM